MVVYCVPVCAARSYELHATCRMPHAARLHAARRVACARYVGFGDCHRCAEGSAIGAFCEYYGADGTIPDWPNPKQVTDSLTVQHVPYETALSTCSLCCNWQPTMHTMHHALERAALPLGST